MRAAEAVKVVKVTLAEQKAIDSWRRRVENRASDVDPVDERDWFDLCYGFMMGRGLQPTRAYELASLVHNYLSNQWRAQKRTHG